MSVVKNQSHKPGKLLKAAYSPYNINDNNFF
jgi:hypothetical protein